MAGNEPTFVSHRPWQVTNQTFVQVGSPHTEIRTLVPVVKRKEPGKNFKASSMHALCKLHRLWMNFRGIRVLHVLDIFFELHAVSSETMNVDREHRRTQRQIMYKGSFSNTERGQKTQTNTTTNHVRFI